MATTAAAAGGLDGATANLRLTPEKYTTIDTLLDHNKPDVMPQLVETYGDQGITGFLKLTGAINSGGTADQIEYFEEGRRHRLVTVIPTTKLTRLPFLLLLTVQTVLLLVRTMWSWTVQMAADMWLLVLMVHLQLLMTTF